MLINFFYWKPFLIRWYASKVKEKSFQLNSSTYNENESILSENTKWQRRNREKYTIKIRSKLILSTWCRNMGTGLFKKYCTWMKFSYIHMVLNLFHNYLLFIYYNHNNIIKVHTSYTYSTKHIEKTYLWTAAQLLLSSSKGYKKISRFYVYATIVYPPALMKLFPFSIEDLVQDALAISVSGPYPMLFPDILLLCVNGLIPYSLAYRVFCLQQDSQDLFLW